MGAMVEMTIVRGLRCELEIVGVGTARQIFAGNRLEDGRHDTVRPSSRIFRNINLDQGKLKSSKEIISRPASRYLHKVFVIAGNLPEYMEYKNTRR